MGKKSYFLSFLLILLFACEQGISPPEKRRVDEGAEPFEQEEIHIDTTDLYLLPIDSGGTHEVLEKKNTDALFDYYIYKPSNYQNNNLTYPLLVFLHGIGERGDSELNPDDLKLVTRHGPPKLIEEKKWNPSYPFLVASPQLNIRLKSWSPTEIHAFIGYLSEKYRVNRNRIYLTGLSLGGQGIWAYGAQYGDASLVSALLPICGSGDLSKIYNLKELPIWAFHGTDDGLISAFTDGGSVQMVQAINDTKPDIKAKVTIYPNIGHNSWTMTYNHEGQGKESLTYDSFHLNIYEWMLQYKKQ